MSLSVPAPPLAATTTLLERVPSLDGLAPIDVAERVRDLPGLVLLESARPAPHARWTFLAVDPVVVTEQVPAGPDPFVAARALLDRLAPDAIVPMRDAPPFRGGLAGFLSYDLGRRLEPLPALAVNDQPLPELRLGLYDLVVGWQRVTGAAWLAGRAVDGDADALVRRAAALLRHLHRPAEAQTAPPIPWAFRSNLGRPAFMRAVEAVRQAIASGEIYQANVARRLEAPFRGEPWPVYRRLRTGDPTPFAAYLDIGRDEKARPRALLSASPEPFLALDAAGHVRTHPIKGTRPRGRSRDADRALACELIGSAKDRAENVMIVDVLRNDLGRVCVPGSVRVPRLCRLERTAAVQHLVSTVTGTLQHEADAFDLLRASFPGGSITGAPKIRAMELIETLEPVRRGPYTGAAVWLDRGGAMGSSILIRTLVADGRRLTLHVGGGMTWRSVPAAEWEETRAKASGPLGAIGAIEA